MSGKKYTLTYFATPGRAETARMMFHLAGVEFNDVHIQREEWPECKSDGKWISKCILVR